MKNSKITKILVLTLTAVLSLPFLWGSLPVKVDCGMVEGISKVYGLSNKELTIGGVFNQKEARNMLDELNDFRTSDTWCWNSDNTTKRTVSGLNPLKYDYGLEKIAMQRAMETAVYWDHNRPSGGTVFKMLPEGATAGGENIAWGSGDFLAKSSDAFNLWREENRPYSGQGHRRNMLNPNFDSIGIASVKVDGITYWVQVLTKGNSNEVDDGAFNAYDERIVNFLDENINVQSVKFSKESLIIKGEPVKLPKAIVKFNNAKIAPNSKMREGALTLNWSSANPEVAIIEDGKVIGKSKGETVLLCENLPFEIKKEIKVEVKDIGEDKPDEEQQVSEKGDDEAYLINLMEPLKINKVSRLSSNKVRIIWSRLDGVDGYEISRSLYKSKKIVVATVMNEKPSTKLLKVKAGIKHYYRIRAFKVVNGEKVYGNWSKYKRI